MTETLREVRERKGVKKGAVAEAMGVTYPTYQRYEETNAHRRIRCGLPLLGRLARFYFFGQRLELN